MKDCYLCGISEKETFLYEGISKKKIVFVCRKCYFKSKIPLIINKDIDWKEVDKPSSVRSRLARLAKIDFEIKRAKERFGKNPQDVELKDLVEKNLKREFSFEEDKSGLVDNFNWIIIRKRRLMKLSREELAEAIAEDPLMIKSLEEGKIPKDYFNVIKKVENYLVVRLFKSPVDRLTSDRIVLESKVPSGLLISDLKKNSILNSENLNLNKVREILGDSPKKSSKKNLEDLDDKEIQDLVWGNKLS